MLTTKIRSQISRIFCFKKTHANSSKCGIIITYHNHAKDYVIHCLDSVLEHTPSPRYIVIFDNESSEKDAIDLPKQYKRNKDVKFIRIRNQLRNGGLTGTWNQGIRKCLQKKCEKIILLNHDTIVDESWPLLINAIKENKAAYGPVSNNPGFNAQQQISTKEASILRAEHVSETERINGFCWGFTKKCLEENMYDMKHYFDPAYPFGGNETEWQKRLKKNGGIMKIAEGCFVYHHKDRAWEKIKLLKNQWSNYSIYNKPPRWFTYIQKNPDLKKHWGSKFRSYVHYYLFGFFEKREF